MLSDLLQYISLSYQQNQRIGIDIDGTITAYPEFFSEFSSNIKKNKGLVHIISSRTDYPLVLRETKKELESLRISYDHIYLLPNITIAEKVCPHGDLDWYQKYIWQKVNFCVNRGIGIFFDDEDKVIELFNRYAPEIIAIKP